MPDIGTAVAYLVATVELAQVRSIRNAVRENLVDAGGVEGPLGTVRNPKRVDLTRQPDPDYHGSARHVSSATSDASTRSCECERVVVHVPFVPAIDAPYDLSHEPRPHVGSPCGSKAGPLVPPWRLPLVPDESAGPAIIKCPPPPPDVIGKGLLLDFYM